MNKEGRDMNKSRCFLSVLLLTAVLAVVCIFSGKAPLLAADTSAGFATLYEKDGTSKCFNAAAPHHVWNYLDAVYFKDIIYRGWYTRPDLICGYPKDNCLIRYYSFPATSTPPESSDITELEVEEYPVSYVELTAMRFAVFQEQLFILYAKHYTQSLSYHIFYTHSPDGETWSPTTGSIVGDTGAGGSGVVQAMIAKVIGDKLYVLIQLENDRNVYLITYDGQTWSGAVKIYTFGTDSCILNGDLFSRSLDGQTLLFIVTNSGDNTNRLFVYDPSTNAIFDANKTIPVKMKNAVVLQGNVYGSNPYNISSMQIWGIEKDGDNLWHFQYILNPDGHSVNFASNGVKVSDTLPNAKAATYVHNDTWNYMAAYSVPAQVVDNNQNVSLQLYDWIWWWGSTTTVGCGRSLRYAADYLKNSIVGEATGTDPNDPNVVNGINRAWILLGVITGLPPYYPNGIEQEWLEDFYKVSYGVKQVTEVSTTVKSEKKFSIGYEKEFKPGHISIGTTYANSAEDVNKDEVETEAHTVLEFSPSAITYGMKNGNQAWAIFLAPYIVNNLYEVYAPDKTTDLGMTLYYTYIGDNSSIVAKLFDMTDPSGFYAGIRPMPNSLDYEVWKTGGMPVVNTSADYNIVMQKELLCESSKSEFSFDQTKKVETEHTSTNTFTFKGGAFGFETELEGSLSLTSSNSTSLGMNITVSYGLPGFYEVPEPEPADFGLWLTQMDMNMYLLNAKTENAEWIPEAAKTPDCQQYPWCLTWKVNSYCNVENQPVRVGASQTHKTVSAVLAEHAAKESISIVLKTSASEPGPVTIAGKSVSIMGDYSTLSRDGNPTLTLCSSGFTVEEGAHLFLENLILDSTANQLLPGISNKGGVTIRNCTVKAGSDGIILQGGNLASINSLIVNCGENGVRMAGGHFEAYNCELTSNNGYGLQNDSGTAFLNHCALFLNKRADLFSNSSGATTEVLNTAFGLIGPHAKISQMSHCLVETLPQTVVISVQDNCRMNTPSGYIFENGEITDLSPDSALINTGMAKIPETRDIRGNLRDETPDVGCLEHTDSMDLQSIENFTLKTITDPNPSTATDMLAFTLSLKVPENLTLKKDGRYAVGFGDYLISSGDFNESSINSDKSKLIFNGPGNLSMSLEHEPGSSKLIVKVNLSDIRLYQDIARYVTAAKNGDPDSTLRVSLPIEIAAADIFQTGHVMMNFKLEVKDGVGTGSDPRLVSKKSCDSDDDDDACFISILK